jgi:hypothetical protein
LIEYFDPACAGSRSLHLLLDEAFEHAGFQHVVVPVAVGRGADPTFADALCALPDDEVWKSASAWSRNPPDRSVFGSLDPDALEMCAGRVEAATQFIASLPETGHKVVTPVVEFRGRVYAGSASTEELLLALRRRQAL